MEIIKKGQSLTIKGNDIEMNFYIKYKEDSSTLQRIGGTVSGTLLKVSDSKLTYKKSGRGRIKDEVNVFKKIDEVENFLKINGYLIVR